MTKPAITAQVRSRISSVRSVAVTPRAMSTDRVLELP
jgi:hypothetical protein